MTAYSDLFDHLTAHRDELRNHINYPPASAADAWGQVYTFVEDNSGSFRLRGTALSILLEIERNPGAFKPWPNRPRQGGNGGGAGTELNENTYLAFEDKVNSLVADGSLSSEAARSSTGQT